MIERVFVDTNILIYARDVREPVKRERAGEWLRALASLGVACLNLQVLNEFTRWVLRREPHRAVDDVRDEVSALSLWGAKPLDVDEVEVAWLVWAQHRYQWFDCLLIAAADRAGCRFFLTEDMIDRSHFRGLTLINPFLASPSDVLSRH